jgi:MFS family permease
VRKSATGRAVASGDIASSAGTAGRSGSPWRAVVGFGVVSLAADMVYEGARSVTGPLMASLGASAVLVGLVSGAGEAMALLLRVVFGSWADRSGRYWTLTFVGYALTAICVPALAITPFLAGAGLAVACILILGERFGKAVRSPAKTALLAHAAADVGLGRGFGVHKALDQIGAVAGPVLVAAVIAAAAGSIWPAMAVLVVPGAVALLVLVRIRRSMGDPVIAEPDRPAPQPSTSSGQLPREFWLFAAASAAISGGLVTFAVIAYHLTQDHVVPVAAVPLIYAAAMGAAALAALGSGWLFDRTRGGALLGLPLLVSVVPVLAFSGSPLIVIVGVLVWGVSGGVLDSTIKALVADLVPAPRLATAYGVFAAVQGAAAIGGGVMAGALYERSLPLLIVAVAASQVVALVLLIATLRRRNECKLRRPPALGNADLFQSSGRSPSSR